MAFYADAVLESLHDTHFAHAGVLDLDFEEEMIYTIHRR